ncbi:MAG TPA: ketopantoate reductase family protein [Miltoncostaeaceae bacterium]|jgi:2-dehydropantoate 2-reductase|nr:ketopantoate reductase family protein [Miltoncostaeaceae bacterium]
MGAGAVGSYYGALLARDGHEVTLVARGAHLEALRERGAVVVHEADGRRWEAPVAARARPEPATADLVIVTTKSQDTLAAARALRDAVPPGTPVLSLQNGVENVGRIGSALGHERALGGIAFVGVRIAEPGVVHHQAEGWVRIGHPAGADGARAAYEVVVDSWDVVLSEDIVRDQWHKLLWNAGFNAICAVTGATAGEALALPASERLVRAAMGEVVTVAAAHGVTLTQAEVDEMARPNEQLIGYRPSTAQDLEAGKRLERDALCGFLAREGARLGLPTPVNTTLDALLALRESGAAR